MSAAPEGWGEPPEPEMASIAQERPKPGPGGGRPTGEPTPRLPHRMVPAYPPFGAFGFTTYGIQISRVFRNLASLPREPIWQGIKRERHFVVRCLFESTH